MKRFSIQGAILLWLLFLNAGYSGAFIYDLVQPGQREFILDKAELINDAHKEQIRTTADKILTDTANPIIVVTIKKMSDHVENKNFRIETFAHFLFDQWEIGNVQAEGFDPKTLNRGILLLISKGDRKARIQLGAGWGREHDSHCQKIMDRRIIPKFKAGDFSGGIKSGFDSLAQMLSDGSANGYEGISYGEPTREKTKGDYMLYIGLILLGIFTIVSLIRKGQSGFAWIFWAAIFGIIFFILKAMASGSGGGGGGGGGYSGGSFGGGGFSGGGGASGSW